MANEFVHGSVGTELTQAEWEGVGTHVFNSQATGDIVYASSSSQLSRLAKGTDTHVLILSSGIPAWSASTGITAVGTIATGVWQGTDIGVAYGGTGVSTLTDGGILLGSGTGAITAMAVLADSEMIVGNGSTDPVAESGATLRTSIGVGTGDSPQFTGLTLTAALSTTSDIDMQDGDKLLIGTHDDLQIFHDGSHSYIQDTATGNLVLNGSGIYLINAANDENMLAAVQDAGVTLYHNGTAKMVTTADGLDLGDNDLLNVGASGNDWTQNALSLSNDYDNNTNTLTVSNTSTASSANQAVVRIGIADASTGDPYMNFNIASDADWALGVDHGNSDRFAISRTHYLDGTNDAVRWALSDGEMSLTVAHSTSYFDYVCDSCGRAQIEMFECCGTVAWHDDVLALKEMALNRDGLEHMAKLGVMSITHDGDDGAEWIGINVQTAQHFTWSAMHQMYERINELETKLEALGV